MHTIRSELIGESSRTTSLQTFETGEQPFSQLLLIKWKLNEILIYLSWCFVSLYSTGGLLRLLKLQFHCGWIEPCACGWIYYACLNVACAAKMQYLILVDAWVASDKLSWKLTARWSSTGGDSNFSLDTTRKRRRIESVSLEGCLLKVWDWF